MLLRNEKEETVVETGRGRLTLTEGVDDLEEKGSGQIRGGAPGSKGDTVWAGSGVVGSANSDSDGIEGRRLKKRGVNFFSVVFEKGDPFLFGRWNWASRPNFRPKNFGNFGFAFVIRKGSVRVAGAKGGDTSPGVGELGFERSDGVRMVRGWGRRRKKEFMSCFFEPIVSPAFVTKRNEGGEGWVESKEAIDTFDILERGGKKLEEGYVLGDKERDGGTKDVGFASKGRSAEEGGFELGKRKEGAVGGGGAPEFAKGFFELRRGSEPERDSGPVASLRRIRRKGEVDGEVVRKGAVGSGEGPVVGMMVKNGDRGRIEGGKSRGRGNEEPIETRGPREGARRVASDVEISVLVMGRIDHVKMALERSEKREKRSGGETVRRVRGIRGRFNEVKVPAEKGGKRGRDRKNVVDELSLERKLVFTCFEVDIKKLEGRIRRVFWGVPSKLDKATTSGRKRDVSRRVKAKEGGGVDDKSASFAHDVVVAGDKAVG